MRKSIGFIFIALLLSGCNDDTISNSNSVSNSISNSSSVSNSVVSNSISASLTSSSVVTNQNVVKLTDFKNRLITLKHEASSCTYSINQIDNYSAINIEAEETGTKNLYANNFVSNSFTQKIGEDTVEGKREIGIIDNKIYQINYYGENDNNNSVKYYENNENSRSGLFSLDFVTEYIMNILDFTISYYNKSGRYSLTTNYDTVTFPDSGTIKLEYHFISYSNDGRVKIEDVQRNDTLTLDNGYIISSKTTMMYGLENNVNYQYMQKECTYEYETLTEYTETKLDPTKF